VRISLEVGYQALFSAGYQKSHLHAKSTGVFLGAGVADLPPSLHGRVLDLPSSGPNRVSYVLGLKGASVYVDTACSASLVAMHLACEHIRTKGCDLALQAGSNSMFYLHFLDRLRSSYVVIDKLILHF
jgi:acyl transferase domain-containing protein